MARRGIAGGMSALGANQRRQGSASDILNNGSQMRTLWMRRTAQAPIGFGDSDVSPLTLGMQVEEMTLREGTSR